MITRALTAALALSDTRVAPTIKIAVDARDIRISALGAAAAAASDKRNPRWPCPKWLAADADDAATVATKRHYFTLAHTYTHTLTYERTYGHTSTST